MSQVTGTGGGTSIRRKDHIFIAPSGVQKELMKPTDMFVMDFNTREYLRKPKVRLSVLLFPGCSSSPCERSFCADRMSIGNQRRSSHLRAPLSFLPPSPSAVPAVASTLTRSGPSSSRCLLRANLVGMRASRSRRLNRSRGSQKAT